MKMPYVQELSRSAGGRTVRYRFVAKDHTVRRECIPWGNEMIDFEVMKIDQLDGRKEVGK